MSQDQLVNSPPYGKITAVYSDNHKKHMNRPPWADEQASDLDRAGTAHYLKDNLPDKMYISCQKHFLINASIAFHQLPLLK
jgi:hypothetical protein